MKLITWNIQWCRGVDGVVDPRRIVEHARAIADFVVLCLQEVARNYPGLDGSGGADQFRLLAGLLPGYTAIEGVAVDEYLPDGSRREFGNMILTRIPVTHVLRHLLPWPPDPTVPTMPRIALEAVLRTAAGPLRVTTTHLEFHSALQRDAAVERLREIQVEAAGHAADAWQEDKRGGPFETKARGPSAILTGDFNYEAAEPIHARLQAPLAGDAPPWVDAWPIANPGLAHPPTAGVFDKIQWKNREFCCDFILVTANLAGRVRRVATDLETAASDHQPVLLELADA
jgi:endonuclease/exonuclease/phosphatase family metal-dependent hydrolase